MGIDALIEPRGRWLWQLEEAECDCDVMALHALACPATPIYAELASEYLDTLNWRLWLDMTMASKQTVIKCAQCGRERLAKDLDVIYKHLNDGTPFLRKHENITKAICPEHNTRGRARWVHERG